MIASNVAYEDRVKIKCKFKHCRHRAGDMATTERVYQEHDSVDDYLLNQISKHIFHDQLGTLSRDLGISNAEHQRAVLKKSPQDQIFQVGNYM